MNSKCAKPTFGSQYFKPRIWLGILAHGCVQLHQNAPPAMDPISANLSCASTKYRKTSINLWKLHRQIQQLHSANDSYKCPRCHGGWVRESLLYHMMIWRKSIWSADIHFVRFALRKCVFVCVSIIEIPQNFACGGLTKTAVFQKTAVFSPEW